MMLLDWEFWRFALGCLLAMFVLCVLPLAVCLGAVGQGVKMLLPWVRDAYRYVTGPDRDDQAG